MSGVWIWYDRGYTDGLDGAAYNPPNDAVDKEQYRRGWKAARRK